MKRFTALVALFVIVLTGCAKDSENTQDNPDVQTNEPPKEEVVTPIEKEQPDIITLSEEDAKSRIAESIDQESYTLELKDDTLSVGTAENTAHEYFIFDVKDVEGSSVGQVAIDKETGEKYHYLGDGTLDNYNTFALYNPAVDAICDWEGTYKGPASTTLEVLQGDSGSFEYQFSEGKTGNARISGNTAKSNDGEISFLFSDGVITVAGGGMTGNYTLA